MEHQHHPLLSIFSGAILSISGYLAENSATITTMEELIKVITFGIIGGAFGYLGRIMAIKIHKKFK